MALRYIPAPGPVVHISVLMTQNLKRTGVYFLYHRDELVYIGQTRTLQFRLDQHLSERRKVFDSVAFIPCTVDRLSEIESHYIGKYAPKYNNCGIAKRARVEHSWRKVPIAPSDQIILVDASEVTLNLYEATELLDVPEGYVAHLHNAGFFPRMSLIEMFNFMPHLRHVEPIV